MSWTVPRSPLLIVALFLELVFQVGCNSMGGDSANDSNALPKDAHRVLAQRELSAQGADGGSSQALLLRKATAGGSYLRNTGAASGKFRLNAGFQATPK